MSAFLTVLYSVLMILTANSFGLVQRAPQSLFVLIPVFLFINLFAGSRFIKTQSRALRVCCHGTILLVCLCISVLASVVLQSFFAVKALLGSNDAFLWGLLFCYGVHFLLFWNGILCVYLTSTQLGIKLRIIGIVCGMIPVANVIALLFIIRTTVKECQLEAKKEQINRQRSAQRICDTKYPILLVHGVFFRDTKYFNYWGRIPRELEANGARIFYGNHHSASSIADSAGELKARIDAILAETNAEKVNIIAHSKGGLDCRYAISKLGIGHKVASLTTVNTPHRGCLFADYLLNAIPSEVKHKVANVYNTTLKKLGEPDPDFLAAVNDLTQSHCVPLNEALGTPDGVFCQSVGSVLAKAKSGKFPLNFSYLLVKLFSGENDGLVSEASFSWGERYILLRPVGDEGISHGDIIDLNRQNFSSFDVREFYVDLVSQLKEKGL